MLIKKPTAFNKLRMVRSIYLRDKDNYNHKEAEEQQLMQYIKNYMDIDPKMVDETKR